MCYLPPWFINNVVLFFRFKNWFLWGTFDVDFCYGVYSRWDFQRLKYMNGKCYSDVVVAGKVVVVVVKASKDISRTTLVWALNHIIQPDYCIKLLVFLPTHSSSNFLFSFQFHLSPSLFSHIKNVDFIKVLIALMTFIPSCKA